MLMVGIVKIFLSTFAFPSHGKTLVAFLARCFVCTDLLTGHPPQKADDG